MGLTPVTRTYLAQMHNVDRPPLSGQGPLVDYLTPRVLPLNALSKPLRLTHGGGDSFCLALRLDPASAMATSRSLDSGKPSAVLQLGH